MLYNTIKYIKNTVRPLQKYQSMSDVTDVYINY